jgi:hypothetical protein
MDFSYLYNPNLDKNALCTKILSILYDYYSNKDTCDYTVRDLLIGLWKQRFPEDAKQVEIFEALVERKKFNKPDIHTSLHITYTVNNYYC